MTTIADSSAMLPFIDVFNAAVVWRKQGPLSTVENDETLRKAVDKALDDLATMAINSYRATLPDKPPQACTQEGPAREGGA